MRLESRDALLIGGIPVANSKGGMRDSEALNDVGEGQGPSVIAGGRERPRRVTLRRKMAVEADERRPRKGGDCAEMLRGAEGER